MDPKKSETSMEALQQQMNVMFGQISDSLGRLEERMFHKRYKTVPSFRGEDDPKVYLNWVKEVDLFFESHNYPEEKKVKLITHEFADYALDWWEQLVMRRRRRGERSIRTWYELKLVMDEEFVPLSYYFLELQRSVQEIQRSFQKAKQCSKETITKTESSGNKIHDVQKLEDVEVCVVEETKEVTFHPNTTTIEEQRPTEVEIQALGEEIKLSDNSKFVEEVKIEDEVVVNMGDHNNITPTVLEETNTPIVKQLNFCDPFWCVIVNHVQDLKVKLMLEVNVYHPLPYNQVHDSRSNRFEEGEYDASWRSISFAYSTPTRHILDSIRKHVQWRALKCLNTCFCMYGLLGMKNIRCGACPGRSRAKKFKEALLGFIKESALIENLEDSKTKHDPLSPQGKVYSVWGVEALKIEVIEYNRPSVAYKPATVIAQVEAPSVMV